MNEWMNECDEKDTWATKLPPRPISFWSGTKVEKHCGKKKGAVFAPCRFHSAVHPLCSIIGNLAYARI